MGHAVWRVLLGEYQLALPRLTQGIPHPVVLNHHGLASLQQLAAVYHARGRASAEAGRGNRGESAVTCVHAQKYR